MVKSSLSCFEGLRGELISKLSSLFSTSVKVEVRGEEGGSGEEKWEEALGDDVTWEDENTSLLFRLSVLSWS